MPSIIQADQLKSADGNTTYLNSGTLSNLTFPAGHVVQTKRDTHNSSAINVTTADYYTTLEVSITFQTNGNLILWWLFVPGVYNDDEINTGINAGVLWSNNSFVSHEAVLGAKQYSMSYEGYLGPPTSGQDVPMLSSISLCEAGVVGAGTNPSAGTAVTIRPVLKGMGGGTPQIFANGSVSTAETATIIVQEVQQ